MRNPFDVSPSTFVVFARSGTAMGCTTWSETNFHAYASQQYAHAMSVSADSTPVSRFFLKERDGQETVLTVDKSFAARDGQLITAAFANTKQLLAGEGGFLLMLYNHNTGAEYISESGLGKVLEGASGILRAAAVAAGAIAALMGYCGGGFFIGLLAAFIVFGCLDIARFFYIRHLESNLLSQSRLRIREHRLAFNDWPRGASPFEGEPVVTS